MPCLLAAFATLALVLAPRAVRADPFDLYTNPVLAKVPGAAGVKEIKQLTPAEIADNARVLPHTTAAFLVVKTNEGRLSKLLVQAARQKTPEGGQVPILLIERYVTYKEGEERAVQAEGANVRLFAGFQFNLDMGQVVPAKIGGDLRFVVDGNKARIESVGKAQMYLVTRPLPEAAPPKGNKMVVGAKFEPRYFNGTFKLNDDGRRSGILKLKVEDKNRVSGAFYSDKDGKMYEVSGKIGPAPNAIQFTIVFPRTRQVFQGWMFTGNAQAVTGYARLLERDTGFYALRVEEGK